ncbi:MAG: hypothetical protein M1838_004886 [Thelocarpon superellum]|nr:MAG: hypothetical protein M1838_004886 [Thelocarpon superellum]
MPITEEREQEPEREQEQEQEQEQERGRQAVPESDDATPMTKLPFPPIRPSHILHCSYRKLTPKARLIPLTPAFLDYLRADGIVLPEDDDNDHDSDEVVDTHASLPISSTTPNEWTDQDSGIYSADQGSHASTSSNSSASSSVETLLDPSLHFRDVHIQIRNAIAELGGQVAPKMNWSAPKDATWIAATNSMMCTSPSDVYLLLKSSDFVTHDLEYAFDCVTEGEDEAQGTGVRNEGEAGSRRAGEPNDPPITYTLTLRKWIEMAPSLEFRCFVLGRRLRGVCQRDLNHYAFLFDMRPTIRSHVSAFFETHLRHSFPEPDFVFDVYFPEPYTRVWLVDVNPCASSTDPVLFSWMELLSSSPGAETEDPESYTFNTPQYSAHKLPKDVVDASLAGVGPMRDLANTWADFVSSSSQPHSHPHSDLHGEGEDGSNGVGK